LFKQSPKIYSFAPSKRYHYVLKTYAKVAKFIQSTQVHKVQLFTVAFTMRFPLICALGEGALTVLATKRVTKIVTGKAQWDDGNVDINESLRIKALL
jgi:hypothetical protein